MESTRSQYDRALDLPETSGAGGVADVVGGKPDIGVRMSGFGGKADSLAHLSERLLLAEAVEEVFPPLKTERLIRLMIGCGKNESKFAPT